MTNINNHFEALVSALFLALTAPDEDKQAEASKLADEFAESLSELEVERAKKIALAKFKEME